MHPLQLQALVVQGYHVVDFTLTHYPAIIRLAGTPPTPGGGSGGPSVPSPMVPIYNLLMTFMSWAAGLAIPICSLVLMWGFYSLLSSHTNIQKRETAKEAIKYAGIGLVGILMSWVLAKAIGAAIPADSFASIP